MSDDLAAKIQQYYAHDFDEADRLRSRSAQSVVEFERVQQMLRARLAPGSRILDVGGATGVHAAWLAEDGYNVTLIDPVPEQVERAAAIGSFEAVVGDARELSAPDQSVDAVLLFGPLYHLESRAERLAALREAARVLVPGGQVFAVGISRVSAVVDSMVFRIAARAPVFAPGDDQILNDGNWTNPGLGFPGGHFHLSTELQDELAAAGFTDITVRGIEAPTAVALEVFAPDPELAAAALTLANRIDALQDASRAAVGVPDLSAHFMAVGGKPRSG